MKQQLLLNKKTGSEVIQEQDTTLHDDSTSCTEEMLDLVDHNDCVVQTLPRSIVYAQNLCSQMRSIWLMIKNKQGQLWITRRSMNVEVLPGYLDGSVVGHVKAGETYEHALIRETQEEAGFILSEGTYKFLGKLTPHEHKAFCITAVYEVEMEQEPANWDRDVIGEWYWMTPEQLLSVCQQGDKFKDTLPIVVRHFYT